MSLGMRGATPPLIQQVSFIEIKILTTEEIKTITKMTISIKIKNDDFYDKMTIT